MHKVVGTIKPDRFWQVRAIMSVDNISLSDIFERSQIASGYGHELFTISHCLQNPFTIGISRCKNQ